MEASIEKNEISEIINDEVKTNDSFKKPILIGTVGRLPRKITQLKTLSFPDDTKENETDKKPICHESVQESSSSTNTCEVPIPDGSQQLTENVITLAYMEPAWSGLPRSIGKDYLFEVLKNGSIIETVNLMKKPFWIFGRMPNCDVYMQHPTISRYHAVLQYKSEGSETDGSGFYLYDLGSTHGTYLNKNRLKPKVYARMQVGHILKLGCSTRSYILNGPEDDVEEESELSVTELKQKRAMELQRHKEEALREEKEHEERMKKEEERGVDWGIGEDAEEEPDLSENPFAQTNNEELYLDDPKKALRGFFEREGLELEYDCNEHGIGQFLCKVELPLDDDMGRPIVAEALHKGKKKEAVVQCALEACRLLDRYGVLRQATHESRKRKVKNWEENDYYDSDDDTFLDRTGAIEKKREKRMNAKCPDKVETYESLLEKEKNIAFSIADLEKQLENFHAKYDETNRRNEEEDSLDTFMNELKESKPDKQAISKLKLELAKLKSEHANVIHLVNIARPASLPPLVPRYSPTPGTSKDAKNNTLPIYGKRKKIKVQLPPAKSFNENVAGNLDIDDELEEDQEEIIEEDQEAPRVEVNTEEFVITTSTETSASNVEQANEETISSSASSNASEGDVADTGDFSTIKSINYTMTFKKFEKILRKGLPPFADKHQEKLRKILSNLKKLASNEDRMHVDWKMLAAKKRKVMKLILDLKHCEPNEKLEHKVSSELNRILNELNTMTEQKYKVIDKVKKMGNEIKTISEAIDKDFKEYKKEMEISKGLEESSQASISTNDSKNPETSEETDNNGENPDEKKKKKNLRRIQQRQEKAEMERQRGYEEDSTREDYSMWVPPSDQSGDGRTSLNDKLGY